MHRRLSIISLLFAWLLATGSQWDLVQTFAWGKMIVTYSQSMPLTEAVRLTFTADNLCGLCVAVSEAKQQQQADDALPGDPAGKLAKIPLVFQPTSVFVAASPGATHRLTVDSLDMQGAERPAPPTEPPRAA